MSHRACPAFSLIELLACLVILALLATAASVSLKSAVRAAGLEEAIGQWAHQDQLVRQHARRFGRYERMVIEPETGRVLRSFAGGPAQSDVVWTAPTAWRLERVVLASHEVTAGTATIEFSPQGQSPSYAILFSGSTQKQ